MNKIEELECLFRSIANESSSNGKIRLLKEQRDNELFIKVLRFVYDDFVRTGVSFKGLSKDIDGIILTDTQGTYDFEGLMDYVKQHNTGCLATIQLIQMFASFYPEQKDFIYHVFAKDLKVGITAKTINKAYGKGFIKRFSVQLAHPYQKYKDKVVGKEFVLTQKLDGHRSICIVKDGRATFYTRKGLVINGLGQQEQQAMTLVRKGMGLDSFVLDGELLLQNDEDLPTKDLFRATSRVLRSETADKTDILFNVFDALPLSEFYEGESTQGFLERKQELSQAFERVTFDEVPNIRFVKNLYNGRDVFQIAKLQKDLVKPLGWEGLMINLADGKYETKRTSNLLKVKKFYDADVVVKKIFFGSGRFEGMMGGIIVDYKGNDVHVGSGFTEEERKLYWKRPSAIVGSVVQINYFEETHNQKDEGISLRFPTFVCVRNDKTADEVSYEV